MIIPSDLSLEESIRYCLRKVDDKNHKLDIKEKYLK